MCGIIGILGRQAIKRVLDGLQSLEYRGYDSSGLAFVDKGKIMVYKQVGSVSNLAEVVMQRCSAHQLDSSNLCIGHTRWATHGKPSVENAHPHTDTKGEVAVIHNGIIENYSQLREELASKGYVFKSETDTEVIPLLIEDEYKKHRSFEVAFRSALLKLRGTYAIVCINSWEEKLYFAKLFNPLVIGIGNSNDEFFCSSDMASMSVLNLTNRFIVLEDNEYGFAGTKGVVVKDLFGAFEKTKKESTVDFKYYKPGKGNYSSFMEKEIMEIPEIIPNVITSDVSEAVKLMESSRNVYMIGCGTSYHAALVAKYVMNKALRKDAHVYLSSEFSAVVPVSNEDVVIAISQSGETLDTITAIKHAKRRGAKVISITNHVNSSIAQEGDVRVYINAGPEISVVATKTFVAQLLVLYKLIFTAGGQNYLDGKDISEQVENALEESNRHVDRWVSKIKDKKDFYFIGRGISYPVAQEGALKLKEITYKHAEAFAGGELKHGPLSLIDDSSVVFAIAPNDSLAPKMQGNILECKSRGAKIFAITDSPEVKEVCDEAIEIKTKNEYLTPISYIIPLQMLACKMTLAIGNDPDKPRNLAKSVTVE